jgi:hypothetical protein
VVPAPPILSRCSEVDCAPTGTVRRGQDEISGRNWPPEVLVVMSPATSAPSSEFSIATGGPAASESTRRKTAAFGERESLVGTFTESLQWIIIRGMAGNAI